MYMKPEIINKKQFYILLKDIDAPLEQKYRLTKYFDAGFVVELHLTVQKGDV